MKTAHYVETITLQSGETVNLYRTEGGALLGLDGAFLEQTEDNPNNPYEPGKLKLVD